MKPLNDLQMVEYLTECTLATVDDLAMKKSRPKGEFARQQLIAQRGIDWLASRIFTNDSVSGRVKDVFNNHNGNVEAYAQEIVDHWNKK